MRRASSLQPAAKQAGKEAGHARPNGGLAPPTAAVNAGHGGGNDDVELERLQRQYPRWRIWRGHTTGDYWAMPPRDHPTAHNLVGARGIGELARRLAEADQRHDL